MLNFLIGNLDYLIIAVYMAVVLGVGFYFNTKASDTEEYLLGRRNMPYIAIGLSVMMSLLSSVSIVRIPGEIYNNGFTMWMFIPILTLPLGIPYYLLFTRFYFKLGSFTPYEYLEYRYDPSVRAIIAISAFYTKIVYLGMVLYTTAKIFEVAYGWAAWFTILFVGIIGVLYTVMGEMKAVVWTDVIQFFVLFVGLTVIIIVLCCKIDGGAIAAVTVALEEGKGIPQLTQTEFYSITPYVRLLFFLMLWNAVIGPLGEACSDQINIQRLLSTKNWKEGFKSKILATILAIGSALVLYFIGFAIFTYYHQHPDPVLANLGGDAAFFRFVSTKLPAPMPGIFMAAILAAIMSTLDSGINSMATVWLKEIHAKFINRDLTPSQELSISRIGTFLIGVFAILLGLGINFSGKWLSQSVTEVDTIFGLMGAAAIPAFLFAVISRRANSRLIWSYTFFSSGEILVKNFWYAVSRNAEQAWYRDPSLPFGWAGKLSPIPLIAITVIAVMLSLPYLFRSLRCMTGVKFLALLGLLMFGMDLTVLLWYLYSNYYIKDVPRSCSFAFGLPLSLIGAFFVLRFCPVQPKEKYQGLTLKTLGEPLAVSRDRDHTRNWLLFKKNHSHHPLLLPAVLHIIAAVAMLVTGGFLIISSDSATPWLGMLIKAVVLYTLLLTIAFFCSGNCSRSKWRFLLFYGVVQILAGLGLLMTGKRYFSAILLFILGGVTLKGVSAICINKEGTSRGFRRLAVAASFLLLPIFLLELSPWSPAGPRLKIHRPKPVWSQKNTSRLAEEKLRKGDAVGAVKLFRLCAGHGEDEAKFRLAELYESGTGVRQNIPVAKRLFLLLAIKGNFKAQIRLAKLCETGIRKAGKITEFPNLVQAIRWYATAAQNGRTECSTDLNRVIAMLRKKGKKGDTDSLLALGKFLYAGKFIPCDRKTAGEMFELAAAQPEPHGIYAMLQLAENFEKGEKDEFGTILFPVDLYMAKRWYERAAAAGSHDAEKALRKFNAQCFNRPVL